MFLIIRKIYLFLFRTHVELCGKVGPVVMRHVRKLNQLKGKTECDRLMLEKHRKTLVVCEKCYAKIHNHAK